jgi:hypothetical protein
VKFPGEFVPLWQIVSLLIVTAGLYGIVLLFRMIRRWCYRNKYCTPATVSFVFGKMAITSKGNTNSNVNTNIINNKINKRSNHLLERTRLSKKATTKDILWFCNVMLS